MTHRHALLLGALCLAGCDQPFVTPETSGPVGIGLKAPFGVAIEECDDSIVNNTCFDRSLPLRSARATNDHASFVGIQDTVALFRGQSVGQASGVIETADDGSFDFEFDVVEIDEQRLELVDTRFEAIYPVDAPAFLTRATVDLRHVKQAYGFIGSLQDLRGNADVVVETTDTQARIGATQSLVKLITGAVPGKATLHTSSGLAYEVRIVGPEQIVALDLYDDRNRATTSLALADSASQRILVAPLLADHRAISGCGADQPQVTVGATSVHAQLVDAGTYCAINVLREEPGPTTVTITWGAATVTLDVEDVPPR
jgi:hypothetical protein